MIFSKILYVFILIGAYFFYILYVDVVSLFLLLFLIIIPLISGILFHLKKKSVDISIATFGENITKNEDMVINVIVSNKSFLPFSSADIYLSIKNNAINQTESFKVKTFVLQKNVQKLSISFKLQHCGSFSVKIDKIVIFDILRLFSYRIRGKKIDDKKTRTIFTISPQLCELCFQLGASQIIDYESDVMSKNKKGDDPSEIFDIHQYIDGDKLNRIHWKLSAKQDELYVKDYSLPINNSLCIVYDTGKLGNISEKTLTDIDTCLEGVLAFSYNLCENEIPHRIIFSSTCDSYEAFKIQNFDDSCYAVKALVQNGILSKESLAIESFVSEECENKSAKIYYFTANIEKSTLAFLENYRETSDVTIITVGEKTEILPFDDSNIRIISVVSGHFGESINQIDI